MFYAIQRVHAAGKDLILADTYLLLCLIYWPERSTTVVAAAESFVQSAPIGKSHCQSFTMDPPLHLGFVISVGVAGIDRRKPK